MRILVAEDEQHLNKLIAGKLQAEHYSVDACFNGQEALDYLARGGIRCDYYGYYDAGTRWLVCAPAAAQYRR